MDPLWKICQLNIPANVIAMEITKNDFKNWGINNQIRQVLISIKVP